ncbi:MAG: DUF4143 domain-containing protein, partial [Acidobacteria bacterium]
MKAYLEAMAVAQALMPVPPFHGGSRREIVKRPKVYGFDTGFVAFVRGWTAIRDEDRGPLWEHLVLDVLRARPAGGAVAYWRDKTGREVDFVLPRGRVVDAVIVQGPSGALRSSLPRGLSPGLPPRPEPGRVAGSHRTVRPALRRPNRASHGLPAPAARRRDMTRSE